MNSIDTNQLLMQLRSAAAQAGAGATTAVPSGPAEAGGAGDNFSSLLTQSINQVNELQQTSNSMRESFEMGDPNVSLPEVMLAGNKAGIAFEGMVQVRNKVVEAYQEIMRMQV